MVVTIRASEGSTTTGEEVSNLPFVVWRMVVTVIIVVVQRVAREWQLVKGKHVNRPSIELPDVGFASSLSVENQRQR